MKFNYKFNRLCGTVYTSGSLLYTSSGNGLLSPVGNRITHFDLVTHISRTLEFEARADVKCMALTSDDRLLVVVDVSNHAMLINFKRGAVLHRFAFKKNVRCIRFSPDDKYFAVTSGKHVQIWLTPSLRREFAPFVLHRTYTGQHEDVVDIHWTRDSQFFIASAKDNTARIFSLHSIEGFVATTLAGHRAPIVGSFFSADDTTCYTVSVDGAVFTWEWHGGEKLITNTSEDNDNDNDNEDAPSAVRKLVDGNWGLKTRNFFNQERSEVSAVSMDALGSLLVVGFTSGVFGLYEMPGCNNIHTLSVSKHRIESVAMNGSGEWLTFGCPDLGQLLVWEWQSESYVLKQQGHSYAMNTMAYSPDSQFIATGGEDGKVKMWNVASGFCFVTFTEHTAPVTAVVFANPSVVLSSSLDGTIRAHDLIRYKNFKTLTTPTPMQFVSLAVDTSGEMVCAGAADPFDIYLWSLQTGKILDVLSGHKGPVCALSFNPAMGTLASGSWDGTVKLWDVYKNNVMETLSHNSDVLCLAWRVDGKQLCAGTLVGNLHFWDTQKAEIVRVIEGQRDIAGGRKQNDRMMSANNSHSRHFTSVTYSADGQCVLAGGNSKYVCIYEISAKILLKKFQISHNRSLDGVLDKLNSKLMSDGGPMDEIRDDDDEANKTNSFALPGAKRGDDGTRNSKKEVRSSCVAYSNTGREFSVVTTEGLLVWSLDDDMVFDPIALTEAVTPHAVKSNLNHGQYGIALVMSMLLNEHNLIEEVIDSTPNKSIEIVMRSVGREHLQRLLMSLSVLVSKTIHLEFYMNWILAVLKVHGNELMNNSSKYMQAFRALYKCVKTRYDELKKIGDENSYSLMFVLSVLEGDERW